MNTQECREFVTILKSVRGSILTATNSLSQQSNAEAAASSLKDGLRHLERAIQVYQDKIDAPRH
jgi:hypothetical protein